MYSIRSAAATLGSNSLQQRDKGRARTHLSATLPSSVPTFFASDLELARPALCLDFRSCRQMSPLENSARNGRGGSLNTFARGPLPSIGWRFRPLELDANPMIRREFRRVFEILHTFARPCPRVCAAATQRRRKRRQAAGEARRWIPF